MEIGRGSAEGIGCECGNCSGPERYLWGEGEGVCGLRRTNVGEQEVPKVDVQVRVSGAVMIPVFEQRGCVWVLAGWV